MTYRERRLAKAERLRGWADKREMTAAELHARNEPYRGDVAFATQPGHIPERARVIRREEKAWEHSQMAERHRERADNIEAAADRAIYSDDEDAVERLRERIAGLEAERDRIKRYNATARKGSPDTSILDEKQRADLESSYRYAPMLTPGDGQFPKYVLANLSGNISRQRKRLADLERKEAEDVVR